MKRALLFFALAPLMHMGPALAAAQEVRDVYSTATEKWVTAPPLSFVQAEEGVKPTILLHRDEMLQTIEGFGGAFNELGWEALLSLDLPERTKVLRDLFSAEGANFSIGRVPIGASDYALSYYSLDDVPDDFTMRNFNIDRDRYILLPYIKESLKVRPTLKLWASPWTPPIWMKVNKHYALRAGGVKETSKRGNEMDPAKNVLDGATAFRMEASYLDAYALYLSKFVQSYRREGVNISAVHVQNEIAYSPQWPSCTWRPEDLAYFIGKHLGPRFEADKLDAEIWLGTINTGDPDYVRRVLRHADAAKYIKGIGLQWAGKNAIAPIGKEYPQFKLMQTESECGEGENNWDSAERTWGLISRYLSSGASAYMYWNMVLDRGGESSWGWPQNTLVSINKETKEVRYTDEYYVMRHLSHFVLPGARRLRTSDGTDHLAFVNPDGGVIVLIVNTSDSDKSVWIGMDGKVVNTELKAKSINTLTWAN